MKKVIVIICIGVFVFSCKTRRVTNKPVRRTTETVGTKNNNSSGASATDRYIDSYSKVAQNEMKLYNIPASITLAQGILESGSGKGRLSIQANNHFGIKCHDWTGKRIYHDDDRKGECFRKYKEAKTSFRDHSLFLSERKRYSALFNLRKGDYKAWARGLKAAGYATDPKYPQKLITLIERYELYKYDDDILNNRTTVIKKPRVRVPETKPEPKPEVSKRPIVRKPVSKKPTTEIRKIPTNKKIHTVTKGDTLYNISKRYSISVQTLKELNNLNDNAISIGQKLQVN